MKELLNELYKKVAGFFQTVAEEDKESSKEHACNRLKLVLMQDRTNLTPYLLERMRGEMIELLSKYVEMDKEALELNFAQEGDSTALMLSIPVLRAKEEEEIKAILEAEDAEKAAAEAEENTEDAEEAEQNAEKECACEGECDETCECGCQETEAESKENSEDDACGCEEDEEGNLECGCKDEAEEPEESSCDCNEDEKPSQPSKKSKKNRK